jgi:hemoglobin-like flavoprotein
MRLDLESLETSFDLVAPRGDELTEIFYDKLFAVAPAVRPLFGSTDLSAQRTMLLSTLVLLRRSLRDLDTIAPRLRALGARHAGYGATPSQYPVVGAVLVDAMAKVADNAWRPEYDRAWAIAFERVASIMLEGAAAAQLSDAA